VRAVTQSAAVTQSSPVTIHRFQEVSVDGSNNSASSEDITGLQHRVYRASGTCDSPGRFTKIADSKRSGLRGRWRGAGLWRYRVTAQVSGQESDPTQITMSALSSGHSGRIKGGTHQ